MELKFQKHANQKGYKMKKIIIASLGKNHELGLNNTLPWPHLSKDLRHFKVQTSNQFVLMGRKTFESIVTTLGKPLPNRISLVVTNTRDLIRGHHVEPFTSVASAIRYAEEITIIEEAGVYDTLFIAGGASVYEQTIDIADEMILSHIDWQGKADTYFPASDKWQDQFSAYDHKTHDGFYINWYKRTL